MKVLLATILLAAVSSAIGKSDRNRELQNNYNGYQQQQYQQQQYQQQQYQQQSMQQQSMQRRMMGQQQTMQYHQEMRTTTDSAGHTTTSSAVDRQLQSAPFGAPFGQPAVQQQSEVRDRARHETNGWREGEGVCPLCHMSGRNKSPEAKQIHLTPHRSINAYSSIGTKPAFVHRRL